MARIIMKVDGTKDSGFYLSLVDTGSTFVVLPEQECVELGLIRDKNGRVVNLRTGG